MNTDFLKALCLNPLKNMETRSKAKTVTPAMTPIFSLKPKPKEKVVEKPSVLKIDEKGKEKSPGDEERIRAKMKRVESGDEIRPIDSSSEVTTKCDKGESKKEEVKLKLAQVVVKDVIINGDIREDDLKNLRIKVGKCNCLCEKRVAALEGEISDLKSWKANRQQLDDIISSWRVEVDKWMRTNLGVSVSLTGSIGGGTTKETNRCIGSKSNHSDAKDTTTSDNATQEFNDEWGEDGGHNQSPSPSPNPVDVDKLISELSESINLDNEDVENVEITPDVEAFGHFLLQNDDDDADNGEQLSAMETEVSEDDDDDNPIEDTRKTRRDIQIIKSRLDDDPDADSDSDCYTISDSDESESETDGSSDEDYESKKRGRPRGTALNSTGQQTKSPVASTSSQSFLQVNAISQADQQKRNLAALKDKKELMKYCKPKPGKLWECTVCHFMLASLDNMLLHVQYNHAFSAHTCPFCRVVVLCRSPKDAAAHQASCKWRPVGGQIRVAKSSFTSRIPTQSSAPRTNTVQVKPQVPVPYKKSKIEDVHKEVNKFVDEILDPKSKTTARYLRSGPKMGGNNGKTGTPTVVVTLSSDDDDDDSED